MQEKAVELKNNVKKVWDKHKSKVAFAGAVICAISIGNEIGYARGYVKCLSHLINAASSAENN